MTSQKQRPRLKCQSAYVGEEIYATRRFIEPRHTGFSFYI